MTQDVHDAGYTGPIPIKHVFIIVKENHTFDNYFGSFPGAEGTSTCQTSMGPITCPHAADPVAHDMCHEHDCALQAWNGGMMNGWDSIPPEAQGDYLLPYGQYQEADIPNYWAYAKTYGLADHFFADMLGPSFPGHLFTVAAQAGWSTGNPPLAVTAPYWGCDQSADSRVTIQDQNICAAQDVFPCFQIPSLPDVLPAGVTWRFYGTILPIIGTEPWTMFDAVNNIRNNPSNWANVQDVSNFDSDVGASNVASVTWLVGQDTNTEHPNPGNICNAIPGVNPCTVCNGENWTVDKVNAIMQSDLWKDSAIFITYDDWGGWYDHVPPPRQYGCDATQPYGLGFRLPLMMLSPYVKPHSVFHEVSEQASLLRFVERVFGARQTLHDLDPAAQDAQANDLFDAFDFTQSPQPPLVLQPRSCP